MATTTFSEIGPGCAVNTGARGRLVFWAALALASLGLAAFAVDLPLAGWLRGRPLPGEIERGVMLSEAFGHGFGVAIILLAALVLDQPRRGLLPRALLASFGAGIAANCIKLCVVRHRPRGLAHDFADTVADTFGSFFPPLGTESGLQSFPSAHAATAAGLAVALIWLYPRGRFLFIALAALAGLQRLVAGAHFLSDVLFGAALGCLVGGIACLGNNSHSPARRIV